MQEPMVERDGYFAGRNCLVLGGAGFIGAALCRELVNRGAHVQAFGRSDPPGGWLPPDIVWTSGEAGDAAKIDRAMQGKDLVFHLLSGATPSSSNVNPTHNVADIAITTGVLDSAVSAGVRKFVFVSSGGAIYGAPKSLPIAEDAATHPVSAYGITKLANEKYVGLYKRLYGLDGLVFRVANPYGHFQSPLRGQGLVASVILRALRGEPVDVWGSGEVVRDYLHISDVVDAMLIGLAHPDAPEVINVGSGVGRSVREVIAGIGEILGRAIEIVEWPGRNADPPANILDSALMRSLGWRDKVRWEDGIADTIQWIAANYIEPPARRAPFRDDG